MAEHSDPTSALESRSRFVPGKTSLMTTFQTPSKPLVRRTSFREHCQEVCLSEETSNGPVVEEISDDDIGYDADIEVVRPDGYEEADQGGDEAEDLSDSSPGVDGLWQKEIIESMKSLDCNSDADDSQDSRPRVPSRKRRSRDSGGSVIHRHVSSMGSGPDAMDIAQDENGRASPKRLRRRSRRSRHRDILARRAVQLWTNGPDRVDSASTRPVSQQSLEDTTTSDTHLQRPDDAMELD